MFISLEKCHVKNKLIGQKVDTWLQKWNFII